MKKILIVFGTRPEAIKMCPLVKEFKRHDEFDIRVCSTGQHREMLSEVLDIFDVVPDYNLMIMKQGQDLCYVTSEILKRTNEILRKEVYDLVLVHGDTTTAYAAAMAAFYNNVPIGHVEAGLRTYNMRSPFPEEFNRKTIDMISNIWFAPTEKAKQNLLKENINTTNIHVTGNTAIDALRTTVSDHYSHKELEWCDKSRLILLTSHRRENIGTPMRKMFLALRKICEDYKDVKIIYPLHLNPSVRTIAKEMLGNCESVHLIEPLNVIDFHNFMKRSYLIVTDSGGIQEEAPALGVPVLVMRNTTERPEGVEAGTIKIVGTESQGIYDNVAMLLDNKEKYLEMKKAQNPYGDGHACERIVKIVKETVEG